MTRAMEIVSQMQQLTEELNSGISDLYKKMSDIDKQMNEIYHEAEVKEFDKESSYEMMMKLQNLARERRSIKFEISYFRKATGMLELDNGFRERIHKTKQKLENKKREDMRYASWLKEDSNIYIKA